MLCVLWLPVRPGIGIHAYITHLQGGSTVSQPQEISKDLLI